MIVDDDAAVDGEIGAARELDIGADADGDDDEVGRDARGRP